MYRALLRQLSPLLAVTGVWELSNLRAERRPSPRESARSSNGCIVAFRWLPDALACLELQLSSSSGPQWRLRNVLSAQSPSLPTVEHVKTDTIIIHGNNVRSPIELLIYAVSALLPIESNSQALLL